MNYSCITAIWLFKSLIVGYTKMLKIFALKIFRLCIWYVLTEFDLYKLTIRT